MARAQAITRRYTGRDNFLGLGVLNEPHGDMELRVLQSFYYKAYERICSVDPRVLVVMSDSWRAGALDGFGCARRTLLP